MDQYQNAIALAASRLFSDEYYAMQRRIDEGDERWRQVEESLMSSAWDMLENIGCSNSAIATIRHGIHEACKLWLNP